MTKQRQVLKHRFRTSWNRWAIVFLMFQAFGLQAQQPQGSGNVRTVQELYFVGNHKFSSEQLANTIPLKVGDVNTKDAIRGALDAIVQTYRKSGNDLSLMVDISLPDKSHTIVKFLIDESGTGGNKGAAPRAPAGAPAPNTH